MSIHIQKDIPLAQYSTFQMGGIADYFIEIENEDELLEALTFIQEKKLAFYILAGGSNTLFMSEHFNGCILKINIKSESWQISDDQKEALIGVGAGEVWDDFVLHTIEKGFSGLEALSLIPGSVGATPVQNVGAYGSEVKDVIDHVRAYDTVSKQFIDISNKGCLFGYRDSVFKKSKGRYIITYVFFRLVKNNQTKVPEYVDVLNYFELRGLMSPNLFQIREAIISIRTKKLPEPEKIPSVGSFFKNPILDEESFKKVLSKHPNLKYFKDTENCYKIPAGWLIDSLGKKGLEIGNLGFYQNNALVVVNKNSLATGEELDLFVKNVRSEVLIKYGIELEVEPNMLY